MKKESIKITESQLRSIVKESVKRVLEESALLKSDYGVSLSGYEILDEMANLSTKKTGLSVIVWVQTALPGNHGNHNAPRVKFQINNGLVPYLISANEPRCLIKNKPLQELGINRALDIEFRTWIQRNYNALMELWNGGITTDEFCEKIR